MTSEARILNVGDDAARRGRVSGVLRASGYEVLEAGTGAEALAELAHTPDLVILDVHLPDIDGFEVARRIRADAATRLLPVLHLSAYGSSAQARAAGLDSGADGYLTQPVEPDELVATVRALLRARRAEREVRLSLEQSSIILRNIADAVTAQDPDGRLVYANDAARSMLGITPGDPLDSARIAARFDIFDTEDRPVPLAELPGRRVLAGEAAARATLRWRRRDSGSERWTEVQACPVYDDEGRVQLAIDIMRDITVERRAAERLALLNQASVILTAAFDVDASLERLAHLPLPRLGDWAIVHLIEGAEVRRVGAHVDPALEPALARLLAVQVQADAPRNLPQVLRDGRSELFAEVPLSVLRAHADGDVVELVQQLGCGSAMSVPLTARGQILGALSVLSATPRRYGPSDLQLLEDLAQRAALAVDSARIFQAAQQAAELRRDLVAVVAHDLKNPLNAIGMAAALLARAAGPDAERTRRQAGIIARATERMNLLIHDLLDISAIDAGRIELERAPVAIGPLVAEALEAIAPLAQQKGIALARDIDPACEPLTVAADRERLLQVFSNLLGNAVKFTAEGGHVRVAVRSGEGLARFDVIDDGPGIEPEHVPHVFDRYWRVRRPTRQGTGLGLSIVKGLVEAHGGKVSVDTALGRGSTFTFTIPLSP